MVYLSHNWGMGDSDCMPCYEPVDVHHRIRTNSAGSVLATNVDRHRIYADHVIDGSAAAAADSSVAHHHQQHHINGQHRRLEGVLSQQGRVGASGEESDGLVKSVLATGGGAKAEGGVVADHPILIRKQTLTPAASEDHHDSDYDEISIHPLSNQVRIGFISVDIQNAQEVESLVIY